MHHSSAALFVLLSMCLCLFTALLLLVFAPRGDFKANFLLGGYFLAFGYTLCVIYLVFTSQIILTPHLYHTGHFSWLLCIPLAYLYVRVTVRQQALNWGDLIHLLPIAAFLIDYTPFLFSSTTYKLAHIKVDLQNLKVSNSSRHGWFLPPYAHVIAPLAIIGCYGFLQFRLLASLHKSVVQKDRKKFTWLLTFSILQVLPVPIGIISMLTNVAYMWYTSVPPAAMAFLAAVNIFLYPELLYGMHGPLVDEPEPTEQPPEPAEQSSAPLKLMMDDALLTRKKASLEKLMAESKPWLNSNYALADLAKDLALSLHQASALINQTTGRNFNDYMNQQRINYAIALIIEGKARDLNMKGIAELCGFNNRNTFTLAFKEVTGMLPSEFRDNIK